MRTIGLINTQDVFVGDTDALKGLGIVFTENEKPKVKRTRAKKNIEKVETELDLMEK